MNNISDKEHLTVEDIKNGILDSVKSDDFKYSLFVNGGW